jgi:hypothetical protein
MTAYQVIRTPDGRPIAGIFLPIRTRAMAERVLAEWQHNHPNTSFEIKETAE